MHRKRKPGRGGDCTGLRLTQGPLSRWARGAVLPPHARRCQGGAGRWLLAEAQTEELGAGFAFKVWGGPWLGKSEQGTTQTEPGCQATHRPGSPRSLEGQSSRPESVDSRPHPCPALTPGPAPPTERVTSGLGDCWCLVCSCWSMDAGGLGPFAWILSLLPMCQNSCFHQLWHDTHSLGDQPPSSLTGH